MYLFTGAVCGTTASRKMYQTTPNNWLRRLLPCCLLALALSATAAQDTVQEEVTIEEGKVALLREFLRHTTWPDEKQIKQFVIGLHGRDRELLRVLNRDAPQFRVRGKRVIVKQYDSTAEARAAHVLVVARSRNSRLGTIVRDLHLSKTLIVTDDSTEERHIMVNFTHPSDTRLSFQINGSNIAYAGLEMSKSILLFGGTKLDAATIYKETEAELVRAKAVATAQQKQLDEQADTILRQKKQVETNKAELKKLELNLGAVQTTLEASENKLQDNELALLEKERVLAEKEAYIESYSDKIDRNLERLGDQQAEIREQERRITEQNTVLSKQLSTIENQQFILAAAAAALLLVLSLISIIFLGYRSKHRINMKLEGKTKELEVANQQLVRMTEAKSVFLSTMSHEIRTPMNGVIGMAELLEGTPLSSQQSEYLSLIIKSADNLLGLLNDILDFSKIEAGKLELEAIPFNLRDILGDTLQGLGLRAGEKGLELTYHIPPDVPDRLIGDPIRLRQVVVNLVGNAIKFTESGEIVVGLKLESLAGRAVRVLFEVRDTGIGVNAQQQRKIFEAFGQADSSTTREFGGTGLGLAICSQLTTMMGGRLAVTSESGSGSTFFFSADFEHSDEAESVLLHPASLRGQRALVVDDNSTNRMILEELLLSWGMVASVVDGGESALAELDRAENDGESFALALLDVMMPNMDGFQLAERIRQRPAQEKLRLLMLTSAGRADQEALRQELGISRILLKPVKHSDLLIAITDALGVTSVQADAAALKEKTERIPARRVLLVEDNPVNQKVARDLLLRRGHRVELAQHGAQAVEMLDGASFDIVLMDVHMPVMDGLTATRTIREKEHNHGVHVPIVAMTAGATTDDRERCFAAGMDAFVTKPFRAAELYAVVEAVSPAMLEREPEPEAAPATGEETLCLDWEGALRNLAGDEQLLLELCEMYLNQYPQLMSAIEAAIAEADAPQLLHQAHTLKGSARMIGGLAVGNAALQLEQMGRDDQRDDAAQALQILVQKVAELDAVLQKTVAQQRTSAATR